MAAMACAAPKRNRDPALWTLVVGCLSATFGILGACAGGEGENRVFPTSPDAELVARFEAEAVRWIRTERERTRPLGMPLADRDRQEMAVYFPEDLLARTRVLVVESLENPAFFSIFPERGEPYPVDLRRASGLALVDTILMTRTASESSRRDRLLFHELVHLAQYDELGLDRYMKGYIESWVANGRDYRAIPHEAQAFELASRYWNGGGPFSVEAEVRSRFDAADSGAGD